MGRLSASIAHEIRNPLAAIRYANGLLAEQVALPAQQRLARIIEDNSVRIDRIVEDVLSIARRERPTLERIDVARFLDNWSIQLGGHEFTTSIAFGLPGLLMLMATIMFWMGRNYFVHVPPRPGGRLGLLDTCCSSMLFMGLIGLPMFFWDILEGRYFWPLAGGLTLVGLALFQWRQRIRQDDGFLALLLFSVTAWLRGDNARARAAVAADVPRDSIRRHWLFAAAAEKFDDVTAEGPLAVLKIISVFCSSASSGPCSTSTRRAGCDKPHR